MSSVKKRVSEDRSVWERLLSFFPGYRGYKDKELLRETDKLVREGIFIRVKEVQERLRGIYRDYLMKYGLTDEARALERLIIRFDTLSQRIRHSEYGYAPLGYAVKVDEEKLDKLVEYDYSLSLIVEELSKNVENLDTSFRSTNKIDLNLLSSIENVLNKLGENIDKRREVILGLG